MVALDLPENYDKEEFARIQKAASKIQSDSEVLVVIGIGGSYLGARAAIDFLSNHFYNLQASAERKGPQILSTLVIQFLQLTLQTLLNMLKIKIFP